MDKDLYSKHRRKVYNIQSSKLCFRDMKIMSLRNGGDFGKQLVMQTRCLQSHHHS